MTDIVIKTIDQEIDRLQAEVARLKATKATYKGSVLAPTVNADAILKYIREHPNQTPTTIAGATGHSYNQVVQVLKNELKNEVVPSRKGRNPRYRLKDQIQPTKPKPKAKKAETKPKKKKAQATKAELNNRAETIIQFIRENPWTTTRKIMETLNLPKHMVEPIILRGKNEGYIITQPGIHEDRKIVNGKHAGRPPTLIALMGSPPRSNVERETRVHAGEGVEEGRVKRGHEAPKSPLPPHLKPRV